MTSTDNTHARTHARTPHERTKQRTHAHTATHARTHIDYDYSEAELFYIIFYVKYNNRNTFKR